MKLDGFFISNQCKNPIYVDGKKMTSKETHEFGFRPVDYIITWNDGLKKKYTLEINPGASWRIKSTAWKEIKLKFKYSSPGNEKNDTITIEDNEDNSGEG